ncbi:hypothetical protein ABPG75_010306 [Micractinium tetrahymenae]
MQPSSTSQPLSPAPKPQPATTAKAVASTPQPLSPTPQPQPAAAAQPLSPTPQPQPASAAQPFPPASFALASSAEPLAATSLPIPSASQPLTPPAEPLPSSSQPLAPAPQPLAPTTQPQPASAAKTLSPTSQPQPASTSQTLPATSLPIPSASTQPLSSFCYWKTHPTDWPAAANTACSTGQFKLGTRAYTKQELLTVMNTPVNGNGLVNLGYQLIAAKINKFLPAPNTPTVLPVVATAIANADTAIGSKASGEGQGQQGGAPPGLQPARSAAQFVAQQNRGRMVYDRRGVPPKSFASVIPNVLNSKDTLSTAQTSSLVNTLTMFNQGNYSTIGGPIHCGTWP